ncbi:MAG: GGDEF domain-containing protein [Nitrospiraceae bacterium]|nr:GGDEF domain-containing protein [Nitrospiraceae bacterium]
MKAGILKKTIRNIIIAVNAATSAARGMDYKMLNKYIIKLNGLNDIEEAVKCTSECFKNLLDYEVFGLALNTQDKLRVWVYPALHADIIAARVKADFACHEFDGICRLSIDGDVEDFDGRLRLDLISYDIEDANFNAKLYIAPRRKRLVHHDEIINIIVSSLKTVLENMINIQRLEDAAATDPLTGCLNRRALYKYLDHDISVAKRYGGNLSLIMFDIDRFKQINDTYGHQSGDKVLKDASELIISSIRKSDYISRYGGEEFIIVLPNTSHHIAIGLAERLRMKFSSRVLKVGGEGLTYTASFGVASMNKSSDIESLVIDADRMLYMAKKAGRNMVMPHHVKHTKLDRSSCMCGAAV